ncbi:MAG TPA: glycerophosphodiester phosphodiesterase family protein [Solirubrobacteraceae bacterium]|nr:glycerophosphodiester phosphodiesterase family protein [Solirubrobacteraceae bacterium]
MPAPDRAAVRLILLALAALGAALPATAAAQADNPWLQRRVLNIAHQGGEDEFPSNTLYAYRRALTVGADMLELDVGVTRDDRVIVMHDTSVDRVTDGRGDVRDKTLRQIRRLDAAYWFSGGRDAYSHDKPRRAYRLRGVATGDRPPPRGFGAADFRVPTLREVLRAFPGTPVNIEIKGRDRRETEDQYLANAEVLARELHGKRHRDLIVVSFDQAAVDRFHELVPSIDTAPGIGGAAGFLLGGQPLPAGSVAMQMPIRFTLAGETLDVTTTENVARAHASGYAWQTWLSGTGQDAAGTWRTLLAQCVDGIMTARPRALERVLVADGVRGPGRRGSDPCAA